MAKIKSETILRNIQKGKSGIAKKTGDSFPGFSFGNNQRISIFKKREIIKPYLHPIDSNMINREVKNSVQQVVSSSNFEENYKKFLPTHLVNDVYSLYYNRANNIKFEGLNDTNKVKFNILDSINNSLIKIVTNNSHIGSYVYAEEISKFLYNKFVTLPPEQQQQLSDALNNCNQGDQEGEGQQQAQSQGGEDDGDENDDTKGVGSPKKSKKDQDKQIHSNPDNQEKSQRDGNNSARGAANNSPGANPPKDMSQEAADKIAKDLENMLKSKKSQKDLEQAFRQAEKKLDNLREIGVDVDSGEELPEDEQKEIIKNLNNLDSIKYSLTSLNTSKEKVLKAVDKILSNTSNYFSQKCITTEVELFEADTLLDINGIELLHPLFRNSRLFDLSVTERKYIGKFDLYVDCSSSMSSGCGGDLTGVCRIDLAKSLAMQMKQLGILGDLYEFENQTKKILTTEISILMMDARGGTDINSVLRKVLQTGNNSVILTDGESNISYYTERALFIGIGTDFHYFKQGDDKGKAFVENGQCIKYDGKDFVLA